uniref:Uncharacterized protein n=1 Tax=Glossina pallidipes TaxID=7398 RepID=A0A1A9ZA47_GLOPL
MQKEKGMHVKANGKEISTRTVTVAAAPFNSIKILDCERFNQLEISFAPSNKGCVHTKHACNTRKTNAQLRRRRIPNMRPNGTPEKC